MIYLLISILFMAALAVTLRLGTGKGADPLGMNAVFRGTAAVIMLVLVLGSGGWTQFGDLWAPVARRAIPAALFLWLSGFAVIKAIPLGHLGISWVVLRSSMVLPTLASLLFWHEVPFSPVSGTLIARIAGVILITIAVVAIGLQYIRGGDRANTPGVRHAIERVGTRSWLLWLSAAFLGQGVWEICLRATRSLPGDHARTLFVTIVFLGTFLFTLPMMRFTRSKVQRNELLYGALAGVCGLLASGPRVWALRDLDGSIVFPMSTIAVILLVQAASRLVWHEKLRRFGALGFLFALGGIALLTASTS